MAGQRNIFHALAHLESHGRIVFVLGYGFVNVGGHDLRFLMLIRRFATLKRAFCMGQWSFKVMALESFSTSPASRRVICSNWAAQSLIECSAWP